MTGCMYMSESNLSSTKRLQIWIVQKIPISAGLLSLGVGRQGNSVQIELTFKFAIDFLVKMVTVNNRERNNFLPG